MTILVMELSSHAAYCLTLLFRTLIQAIHLHWHHYRDQHQLLIFSCLHPADKQQWNLIRVRGPLTPLCHCQFSPNPAIRRLQLRHGCEGSDGSHPTMCLLHYYGIAWPQILEGSSLWIFMCFLLRFLWLRLFRSSSGTHPKHDSFEQYCKCWGQFPQRFDRWGVHPDCIHFWPLFCLTHPMLWAHQWSPYEPCHHTLHASHS